MLPDNANERRAAFAAILEILSASGEISGELASRARHIAELFGVNATELSAARSNVASFDPKAKAS
jgi:hypothetical protein